MSKTQLVVMCVCVCGVCVLIVPPLMVVWCVCVCGVFVLIVPPLMVVWCVCVVCGVRCVKCLLRFGGKKSSLSKWNIS